MYQPKRHQSPTRDTVESTVDITVESAAVEEVGLIVK
jgi:hypothetical protein